MTAAWGVSAGGFVRKPASAILADYQASWLANVDPTADLSPTTPEGQILAIVAAQDVQLWGLAEAAWNSYDRNQVEGAGLDNLGDLGGEPREGPSYTQVTCTLTFTDTGTVHAPGTLIANVAGVPALTFSNVAAVTSNGGMLSVLMQATTIGTTVTINPGALTQITTPVTGWSAVTNPGFQTQLGSSAELDAAYVVRQQAQLGAQGACTRNATVAGLMTLAASQSPPVAGFQAQVIENGTDAPVVYGSLTLPPHTYAPIVYDPHGQLTDAQIGAVIWANKPSGIASFGTTAISIIDPLLGPQTVMYVKPVPNRIVVSLTLVVSPTFAFATVSQNVKTALVAAAAAVTPPNGIVPNGQLGPGKDVIAAQLIAIAMGVPGVYDVSAPSIGFWPTLAPVGYLLVDPPQIATLAAGDIAITEGAGP